MTSGAVIQDEPMKSIAETPDTQPNWREILRSQGRNLSWLAQVTGKSYPQVTAYAQGRVKVPPEWLRQVMELLGEDAA